MPDPIARPLAAAPASPSPARSAAAEIAALFAALERNLARLPSDGDRVGYINLQIEAWEDRERAMECWVRRYPRGENPFAPWTAFSIAVVRARLGTLHAALIDEIKASNAASLVPLVGEPSEMF
jgi:hypothetical protein